MTIGFATNDNQTLLDTSSTCICIYCIV